MANKYETGAYTVRIFDRYGTKRHDIPAKSYIDAVAKGTVEVDKWAGGSFAVLRCLYNSLDAAHPTAIRNLEESES